MQPLTAWPRDTMAEADVIALLHAPATRKTAGAELLDMSLTVLDDLTGDVVGGEVSRASYATLHGTSRLDISRLLDWGRAIIRPHLTLSDGVTEARFNLGAYLTSKPKNTLGTEPQRHAVEGFDILARLSSAVGDTYGVPTGAVYLDQVEAVLQAQGFTRYLIDPYAAGLTLPAAKVWVMNDRTTWLNIVNDLLSEIGYQGIWSDWDGVLRVQRYMEPLDRASEWTYRAQGDDAMVGRVREYTREMFDAPNRWRVIRQNNIDGPTPVEGDGIFTYVNENVGETSVEARGGWIKTRVAYVDAADQPSLETQARRLIAADMDLRTVVSFPGPSMPLHWHFDRLTLDDNDAGPPVQVMGTQWTLPLVGNQMSHEWSVL